MKYKITLEPSIDGSYAVHVPGLPGCHTQGDSVKEALENAQDAIKTYLLTVEAIAKRKEHVYEVEVA